MRKRMGFLEKLLGDPNKKEVKKIERIVDQIEALDGDMQALSDEALKHKTVEFKKRLSEGETLDDIMVEAFAVAREGAVRTLGLKAYRVQLIGGIVLHQGRITEMKTGEGKTLTATFPLYLNALEGKGAHLVTVNDYLAKRDKEWMSKLYNFLGLSVGCIINGVKGQDRVDAYQADITYGTNNEFGFDYLRDNMVVEQKNMVQRKPYYAIVDEVDSILIDEARTPLIISGEGAKSTDLYSIANTFVRTLKAEDDYTIDEKSKSAVLTDEGGVVRAEKFFGIDNLSDPEHMEISHHINNALKANTLMKKDVDYVVKDGEILIVDEFTGRLMFGRRYSNGLHQAIEAKESLEVRKESQTLATITLQNYFRMYEKLAGMTGTAKTEEDEFRHIYNMDVVVIPTNRPIARQDLPDSIYKSLEGKYRAVLKDIVERHQTGQPILVGTIAIETSEFISQILKRQGIKHEVLNAKQHEREAEIVAQAGRFGAVTIATNMAGRGTDIVLGGNPDFMAKQELTKKGYTEEQIYTVVSPLESEDEAILEGRKIYDRYYKEYKIITDEEAAKVKEAGGLHIIGTERHESRRIDNQLRGRSGRQGDPGSSQFYISFDDDLMRLFSSDRVKDMVEKLGMDDDMPLEANILTKSIENAQKKVEGRNFGIRKHVLQYDDVMNRQREIIYTERGKVLHGDNVKDDIENMIEKNIDEAIATYTANSEYGEEWDIHGLTDHLHQIFLPKDAYVVEDVEALTREQMKEDLLAIAHKLYQEKEEMFTPERLREVERYILLKVVDSKWIDHIDAMDQLKQGIGLRAVGQEDPVRAYQIEGFDMFDEMIHEIQTDTVRFLFGATLQTSTERRQQAVVTGSSSASSEGQKPKPEKRKEPKVGRNDPCPCGSGKKYKKCCGAND
jgi:preprotein translocase subunit SecA